MEGKYSQRRYSSCSVDLQYFPKMQNEKQGLQEDKVQLIEKTFKERDSIITIMLKEKNFRSLYNMILSVIISFMLETAVSDYYEHQRIYLATRTLAIGFGKSHIGLLIWIIMKLIVLLLYCAFQFWAFIRYLIKNNKFYVSLWDLTSVIIFIIFQLTFFITVQFIVFIEKLPLGTGISIVVENIRFIMKMHAFVRTNAPLRLERKEYTCSFKTYLYFLFAPTLIYRDEYPQTKKINWTFLIQNIAEFIGAVFFVCYFHENFLNPFFSDFGKKPLSVVYLLKIFLTMLVPTYLIMLSLFYLFFQSWLNFTAELLYFADRRFYKGWWLSPNYGTFFRTWNMPVHEWLYEYIYKDVYTHIFKGSKFATVMTVVFFSAIFHEIVIISLLRFFYPVLFVLFGIVGTLLTYMTRSLPKRIGNLIFLFTLPLGLCIAITTYTIEVYTRKNCPIGDGWKWYFIPATWKCCVVELLGIGE